MTNKKCGDGCGEGVDQRVLDDLTQSQIGILVQVDPCEGLHVKMPKRLTERIRLIRTRTILQDKGLITEGSKYGHFFLTDLGAKVRGCLKQEG